MLEQRPAARQLKCGSDGGVFTETTNGRRETRRASCNFLFSSVEELNLHSYNNNFIQYFITNLKCDNTT